MEIGSASGLCVETVLAAVEPFQLSAVELTQLWVELWNLEVELWCLECLVGDRLEMELWNLAL